jgi:hypothetical protein
MNTFSTEELDREEIEFLPPRVVMTVCQQRWCPPSCYVPKCPPDTCVPVRVCAEIKVGCLLGAGLRIN